MAQTLIAAGYRARTAFAKESTYGVAPTSTTYSWFGMVQEVQIDVNRNPIAIYRMDGSTAYPAQIQFGQRTVETTVTFYPQDILVLADMINNVVSYSHTVVVQWTDINQVLVSYGNKANTVQLQGSIPGNVGGGAGAGGPLNCIITYWSQNVTTSLPSGITFQSDPGTIPFYFTQESVNIGGVTPKAISFDVTITRNLARVFQFGQDYIRVLDPLTATVTGNIVFTVQDEVELNYILNWTSNTITITLGNDPIGNPHTLTITGVQFTDAPYITRIQDIVTVQLPFQGTGASVA